ncbi:hypothetical protein [Methanothermococcus okinawensis]|uniref:hypothetical protein n=1 Tax=Methanothermococcus okinawensis TaxID=155863 RepID=UPI001E3CF78E|nr:hypothetical protein [Methanothermococcus okinawensis]
MLNYEVLNHEDKKDFIVCLDLSGSMRGTKEIWAKAIALSLLEIQLRDKKRFICILFDDNIREIGIFDKKHVQKILSNLLLYFLEEAQISRNLLKHWISMRYCIYNRWGV